MVDCL